MKSQTIEHAVISGASEFGWIAELALLFVTHMIMLASTTTLETFSGTVTPLLAGLAIAHSLVFLGLAWWARRDRRMIAHTLTRFTSSLPNRSHMDLGSHPSDQIEAFLADIDDVLSEPAGAPDRVGLRLRMKVLDERRDYLKSLRFDTVWNVAKTMIEAYPLGGVLGTIVAIGAALSSESSLTGQDAGMVASIMERFGDAIWSTFAGLTAAIVLMFVHSFLEPGFTRLSENRRHVREMVARAKRELGSADQPRRGSDIAGLADGDP